MIFGSANKCVFPNANQATPVFENFGLLYNGNALDIYTGYDDDGTFRAPTRLQGPAVSLNGSCT